MGLVSTGQLTIVDSNDARPITALISASPGPQQVYSKDESLISYLPDWTTVNANAGLVLTAKAYIGGVGSAIDITGQLTNRRWSTDLATAITGAAASIGANAPLNAIFVSSGTYTAVHNGSGSTLTLKANIMDTVAGGTIYFEGDYTDPATSLVSHIVAQISLQMVKTGTNAVYVQTRGNTTIENATGATKNVAVVAADLIRAAGVDTSGVTYRFFESNGGTQIINTGAFTSKYGLKSTSFGTSPTGSLSDIGTGLPAAGVYNANNTLVLNESAVTDIGIYRVEAKDSDGTVYQTYFTIYDVSDPYQVNIISSTGDKLQNGQGSTTLTPEVYYGASRIADLTGWSFLWTFYNRAGLRGAFIDTSRTAVAGGRNITVNTGGVSAVITYDGAAITFAAGDIIKVVMPDATERFYEVASGTGNTVTIRTASVNTFLNYTNFPAPTASQAVGGKLFVCVGTLGQRTTTAFGSVTLTGDEVDIKAKIAVDASRP